MAITAPETGFFPVSESGGSAEDSGPDPTEAHLGGNPRKDRPEDSVLTMLGVEGFM